MSEKCKCCGNVKHVVKCLAHVKSITVKPVKPTKAKVAPLLAPTNDRIPQGLIYVPKFLSPEEHDKLLQILLNDSDRGKGWKTAGAKANRLVRHYGYNYPYTAKRQLTLADPIPDYIFQIIQKLRTSVPELSQFQPDQAIINRYLTGEGIGAHIDHTELFGDIVVSVSLGCQAKMRFRKGSAVFDQVVKPLSAYAMTGESRYDWTHEMPKSKSQRDTRFSITFRQVKLEYLKKEQHPHSNP